MAGDHNGDQMESEWCTLLPKHFYLLFRYRNKWKLLMRFQPQDLIIAHILHYLIDVPTINYPSIYKDHISS